MTVAAKQQTQRPTVLTARKQLTPIWSLKNDDDRMVIVFIAVSIVAHSVFFLFEGMDLFSNRKLTIDEWVMDAEIVSEVDFAGLEKSSLPDALPSEEIKVSERMLPQITKTFSVKEDTKPEEAIAEEKVKEEVVPEKKVALKPEKTVDLDIKTQNKEDNKLDQKDAAKRLAMERLRQSAPAAKTNEAEKTDDDIANKILNSLKTGVSGGTARGKQIINQYVGMVRRVVKGNYSLPEAYNLKGANMQVTIMVVLSVRGDIVKLGVEQSSGDSVFDNLTLTAVKSSNPLPKPPAELVGEKILLVFTP